jgi:hypothetical protein
LVGIAVEMDAESSKAERRVVRYIVAVRMEWQERARYLGRIYTTITDATQGNRFQGAPD